MTVYHGMRKAKPKVHWSIGMRRAGIIHSANIYYIPTIYSLHLHFPPSQEEKEEIGILYSDLLFSTVASVIYILL